VVVHHAGHIGEALNQRLTDLQKQAENDLRLAEARERLQPGDRVVVPRFGYDRPGRVVKVDSRKRVAVVSVGQMQWDVKIDELIPQLIRNPDAPESAVPKSRATTARPGGRLEEFRDDS
jgi:DNA mismatch repair protein MutS2